MVMKSWSHGWEEMMMQFVHENRILQEGEGFYYDGVCLLLRVCVREDYPSTMGIPLTDVGIPIEQAQLIDSIWEDIDFDRYSQASFWILVEGKFREPEPALREELVRQTWTSAHGYGGLFGACFGTVQPKLVDIGDAKLGGEWGDKQAKALKKLQTSL